MTSQFVWIKYKEHDVLIDRRTGYFNASQLVESAGRSYKEMKNGAVWTVDIYRLQVDVMNAHPEIYFNSIDSGKKNLPAPRVYYLVECGSAYDGEYVHPDLIHVVIEDHIKNKNRMSYDAERVADLEVTRKWILDVIEPLRNEIN
jgi:hypothetical protein